jgi:hypothetical protein
MDPHGDLAGVAEHHGSHLISGCVRPDALWNRLDLECCTKRLSSRRRRDLAKGGVRTRCAEIPRKLGMTTLLQSALETLITGEVVADPR